MDSAQLRDHIPERALPPNQEQQYAQFELQHRLLPFQPPSPISQSEAEEAHHYSSVSLPASSRSSVISSLHSSDQERNTSRKGSFLQESSAANIGNSEARHKQRTSDIRNWSRYLVAASRIVNKWWLLEMASCLVALTSAAATVTILAIYNDRPLPHWPYNITVNSLISLFVTISKAALLLPIAEGISQLKWLWFRHPRYLNDFNTFDLASRGPWGACQLLISLRGLHMASLGSLLTIAALAIDPFTQQVVQYTTRNVPMPYMNASLPRRNNFNPSGNSFSSQGRSPMDQSLKAAIYNSLYNPSGGPLAIKPNCPTGNCTFPVENGSSFSSIGVCSRCAEITDDIHTICYNCTAFSWTGVNKTLVNETFLQCNHTLPNSQRLIIRTDELNLREGWTFMVANSTLGSINGSLALQDISTAFSNFSMLSYVHRNCTSQSINDGLVRGCSIASLTLFAVECALFFCVQSYTASVENNVLSEQVVSEFSSPSRFAVEGDRDSYVLAPQTCVVNGKSQDLASFFEQYPNNTAYLELYDVWNGTNTYVLRDCIYSVLSSAHYPITEYFKHYFDGIVSGYNLLAFDFSPDILQTLYNNGNATLELVTDIFANLATSMTNNMRQNGDDVEKAWGLTYKNEVYINVRWAWLMLPISLVLLSIVFLVITMIQSANADIWKSSSLALLYHGLQDGQHDGAVTSIQQMEDRAKNHRVTLRRTTSHGDLRLI